MPVLAVMYPSADSSFDHGYYMQVHIPLVRRLWEPMGLEAVTVMRGVTGPEGTAPTYSVIALLTFGSMQQFKSAAAQHGKEIFADIPKFSSASPVIQFNEPVA